MTPGRAQDDRARLAKVEESLKADVPRVLCLSPSLMTGGQPSERAFGVIAKNGFRTVLNLRAASEGIDPARDRAAAEREGMRYLHIPVESRAPRDEQAEEFVRVVRDESNHPIFVHCATANRVGAFMLIYRVLEDGWGEERALEEATRIGLRGAELQRFALDYVARKRSKTGVEKSASSAAGAAAGSAGARPAAAAQAETRCGWFVNPTPANASLHDRDGEWVVGVQGGHQAEGDWPGFAKGQWVETNGHYGYGCACMKARVERETHYVLAIESARARPLSACRRDRALKRWGFK